MTLELPARIPDSTKNAQFPADGGLDIILVTTKLYLMASTLELIAGPRRQRLLQLMWDRERTAGDLAAQFDVTFGAISQHLRLLSDANLVEVRRVGRSRIYRAKKESFGPLAAALQVMWSDQLAKLKQLAESEIAATTGHHVDDLDSDKEKK